MLVYLSVATSVNGTIEWHPFCGVFVGEIFQGFLLKGSVLAGFSTSPPVKLGYQSRYAKPLKISKKILKLSWC